MTKKWYLVAYDVRDPKRLRQTAKKLLGYGTRVQYSLFRCRLTAEDLERLNWELIKILSEEDDLLIIEVCDRCAAKIRDSSGRTDWDSEVKTYDFF
ncbi:MAG: CRISPR-associated endonuclease Cas2 [Planctomycetia bacterium]|nr:CRISPR-associated endonuclease Cas2 [Planctomycetia bacterium]